VSYPDSSGEPLMLQGIGVSPGVATGPAHILKTEDDRFVERRIAEDEIPREIARFEDSLIATRAQLHEIQRALSEAMDQESASIFDAHLLVVDDRSFVEEVIRSLEQHRVNAEGAVHRVAEQYAAALSKVEDDYLRERAADVRDVARRILRNLSGQAISKLSELRTPCIVIASDIPPSETAGMRKDIVTAFATDLGSPSSHTAIVARALGIPAVVGLHDVSTRIQDGDPVLIDGQKGTLIVRPTDEHRRRYGRIVEEQRTIRDRLDALRDEPAILRDGRKITLSANIELPRDVALVREFGGEGVGLFRTEFLYISSERIPSEEEQTSIYAETAAELAPAPLIIRTIDLGGDKFFSTMKMPDEMNPFMGCRAIRFCLTHPDFFLTQLRAILRASRHDNVKIMYPMISSVDEVIQANQLLEQAKAELRQDGIPFNEAIEVGAMIEIPSAALTADLIARHVSFFSIGTNDLVQYTLAVDRVNERVAYLYNPTHPAIIRLIRQTVDAARRQKIWAGICGEMAGNPVLAPLLIGLGANELSVSPSLIPMVKAVLRKLSLKEARKLASQAVECGSAGEINRLCRELVSNIAPDVLELVG
jgi:phosphoenolpyruvate-protein phosphotransferase (PTS system enzyme I)